MFRISLSIAFIIVSTAAAHAQAKTLAFCAADYMEYCSDYPITSAAVRTCMADVGSKLSPRCINALIEDGFVNKQAVIDRAAKQGITLVETPDGLQKGTATPLPPEPKPTETAKPVEETKPVEVETAKVKDIPLPKENIIKRAAKKTVATVKKVYTKAKTAVKKHVAKNKEYSKQQNIQDQNKLRERAAQRDIVSDGVNSNFGRYVPRDKGYSRKRFEYSWKKHMEDHASGTIRSGGINAKF